MSNIPCRLVYRNKNLLTNYLVSKEFHLNSGLYQLASEKSIHKPEAFSESRDNFLKDYEKISRITERLRTKKSQRPPFAKNLFLGKFDAEILTYPELEKEDLENLQKTLGSLSSSSEKLDQTNIKALVQTLGRSNFIGLQAPHVIDGRDCNVTESCRIVEALSSVSSSLVPSLISNEYLGIQALIKFGTDQLKKKYLTRMLSGELICSFCLLEPFSSNASMFCTEAALSEKNDNWVLNGEKIWTMNGNSADLFIVLARTGTDIKDGVEQALLTAFLVEKSQPGLKITTCPMNVNNLDMSNIQLSDVTVPSDQVLGNVDQGKSVLQALIPEFRLICGVPCTTVAKSAINEFTKFCLEGNTEKLNLYEAEEVLSLIGQMSVSLYAMESILYLTTGLIDQFENQDCELESAIVKTFNAEQAHNCVTSCINFIGSAALTKKHWCNSLLNESLKCLALQESQDNMKIMIALMGLRHAGLELRETVRKLRNPLFNSGFILKKIVMQKRQANDNPKLNLGLENYLHPSLVSTAKQLEYCVLRLQFGTEILLSRHGSEVINQHIDLKRLAECVIDIYTMTACLGRASRSYCIGLQNSDYEMILANTFCTHAMERVKTRINKIFTGEILTGDKNCKQIGKRVFKFKQYFPVHPLTRNF